MDVIAKQPYIKMERVVSRIDQKNIKHERTIYLYPDRIKTRHREFAIDEVIKLSEKRIGTKGGLLYIHTTRGLFSYTIQTTAKPFIDAFKQHFPHKS